MIYFDQVCIRTPQKVIDERSDVAGVFFEAMSGFVCLLPNHADAVILFNETLVVLNTQEVSSFYLGNGMCQVQKNEVTIFTESCLLTSDLDYSVLISGLEALRKKIANADATSEQVFELMQRMREYQDKLKMLKDDSSWDSFTQ